MVCLGFEPGVARWKMQTNPLSYGGTLRLLLLIVSNLNRTNTITASYLAWDQCDQKKIAKCP